MNSSNPPVTVPAGHSRSALLRLQQFADSALPIGGAAHSFGIEALVEAAFLGTENLESFLADHLEEIGALEAGYCAASCDLARTSECRPMLERWLAWNAEISARRLARESRDASAAMGRRFLLLAANAADVALAAEALELAEERGAQLHLAPCFGLAAGATGIEPELAAGAYLQQSITTLLACCQRLMPLGQMQAQRILWRLRPAILDAARRGASTPPSALESFSMLPEVASARHPVLEIRLFIS